MLNLLKDEGNKNQGRNSGLKKYFLSNFCCVVTVHLTLCHFYMEHQSFSTEEVANVEEKEKNCSEAFSSNRSLCYESGQ